VDLVKPCSPYVQFPGCFLWHQALIVFFCFALWLRMKSIEFLGFPTALLPPRYHPLCLGLFVVTKAPLVCQRRGARLPLLIVSVLHPCPPLGRLVIATTPPRPILTLEPPPPAWALHHRFFYPFFMRLTCPVLLPIGTCHPIGLDPLVPGL